MLPVERNGFDLAVFGQVIFELFEPVTHNPLPSCTAGYQRSVPLNTISSVSVRCEQTLQVAPLVNTKSSSILSL